MSEYRYVEKPFLDQLEALGWTVVDQGMSIPKDPTKSFRNTFREVILKERFKENVSNLNRTEDGTPWLTDHQLDDLYLEFTSNSGKGLIEANKDCF